MSKKSLKTKPNKKSNAFLTGGLLSIISVIIISIGLSLVGVMLSSVFSVEIIRRYMASPMLFILNTVPLTLIMLFIYFITSRVWVSYLLGGGFFLFAQLVNRFKVRLRQEPLVPADLVLGDEITKVINLKELPFTSGVYLLIISFLIGGVLLFFTIKSKKTSILFKLTGVVLTVAISLTLYFTVYKNSKYYTSFKVYGSEYSSVDIVQSRGFVYTFLAKMHSLKVLKHEGYSAAASEETLKKYAGKEKTEVSGKSPHVFCIMSEAFFDIDKIPGIKFSDGYNPLRNFNRIKNQSYYGRVVTDVFGGGTSKTEFSFLTGHTLSITDWVSDAYTSYIRKDTYALPRAFEAEGYNSTAFHPGFPWFYNRFNVYDFLGFQKSFFEPDMNTDTSKDYYVSDMEAYKFLLNDFDNYLLKTPDLPYFNFTVTIQNHGPYSSKDIGFPEILKRSPELDSANYHIINSYLNGLMQCDEALGFLVEHFEKTEEPVVLLYFGDHLPYLGPDFAGYKALKYNIGTLGELLSFLNTYETPYFIWSNKQAKELLSQKGTYIKGQAPLISVNYLGTELLNYLGISSSPYFNFLNEIKASIPVITNRFYKTDTGKFIEGLTDKEEKIITQYRDLQYYLMFDNKLD